VRVGEGVVPGIQNSTGSLATARFLFLSLRIS
jgi:hypothetical protein